VTDNPEDLRKWRLPRGRHGLPRELITRSQRERLLAAVVRTTATKGYEATTVADILQEAGVGRESFYELFDDKRDCTLAAHTLLVDDLEAKVREAYTSADPWPERMHAALASTLDWFAADPAAARFVLVELGAVGPPSRERFLAIFSLFIEVIDEGIEDGAPSPDFPQATSLAVSGVVASVCEGVAAGRAEELPERLPELLYEMLVPFLGEKAARMEQERALSGPTEPSAGR
jgi:AcrR family transcriptional regulator